MSNPTPFDSIRANPSLSNSGKKVAMAKAWVAADAAVQASQASDDDAAAAEKAQLVAQLFGPPSPPVGSSPTDAIVLAASFRDALARAQACTDPNALAQLMSQADAIGDQLQVRAGAAEAWLKGWRNLVAEYRAENPSLEAQFARLDTVSRPVTPTTRIMQQINGAVPKPPELFGMDSTSIARLASSDDNNGSAA